MRLRTEKWVGDEQGGFRKGRGSMDQIFSLTRIIEKYLEKGQKLYAAFMDLEKAYDKVDREGIWKVLRMYGVTGRLFEAVKSLYEGAKGAVRVEYEQSKFFDLNVRLQQGCIISPWLFNVYIDGVIKEIQGRAVTVGVSMIREGSEWKIPVLLFIDDTVLLSDNWGEL